MPRTKLSKILDIISLIITIFVFSFYILNHSSLNNNYKIILSCFITVVLVITILKITNSKNNSNQIKNIERKEYENILFALKFGDQQKIHQFWQKLFGKKYEVIDKQTHLVLQSNQKEIIFIYNFKTDEIPLSSLTELDCQFPTKFIYFCARNFSNDAITFSTIHKNITLLDFNSTVTLLKKYSIYPSIETPTAIKASLINKITSSISRLNTLKFIKYALILLIIGFTFKLNFTYYVFAVLLLLMALASIIKNSKLTPKNINI